MPATARSSWATASWSPRRSPTSPTTPIKYTPPGGTRAITTAAQPAPSVTVTDTGPGIPAEQREHAKQRFVRLDAQRSTPGSGLGLSLVDAVAKLHDAKLTLADNAPGPAGHR